MYNQTDSDMMMRLSDIWALWVGLHVCNKATLDCHKHSRCAEHNHDDDEDDNDKWWQDDDVKCDYDSDWTCLHFSHFSPVKQRTIQTHQLSWIFLRSWLYFNRHQAATSWSGFQLHLWIECELCLSQDLYVHQITFYALNSQIRLQPKFPARQ